MTMRTVCTHIRWCGDNDMGPVSFRHSYTPPALPLPGLAIGERADEGGRGERRSVSEDGVLRGVLAGADDLRVAKPLRSPAHHLPVDPRGVEEPEARPHHPRGHRRRRQGVFDDAIKAAKE